MHLGSQLAELALLVGVLGKLVRRLTFLLRQNLTFMLIQRVLELLVADLLSPFELLRDLLSHSIKDIKLLLLSLQARFISSRLQLTNLRILFAELAFERTQLFVEHLNLVTHVFKASICLCDSIMVLFKLAQLLNLIVEFLDLGHLASFVQVKFDLQLKKLSAQSFRLIRFVDNDGSRFFCGLFLLDALTDARNTLADARSTRTGAAHVRSC